MIEYVTRQSIFDSNKAITSEIVEMQKSMFDDDSLFEDGDDGKWYIEMHDAISIRTDDIKKYYNVISFDHDDISTFTTALSEKLTQLLTRLNVSDLIVIADLNLEFIGDPKNKYPPYKKAIRKYEYIAKDLKYKGAFKINLIDLPDFIEIVFWITRCDPRAPEYIYFSDVNEKIAFSLCKYGSIHLIEYEKDIVSDVMLHNLDMYIISGNCEEKFSSSSKIEGRRYKLN